MTGARFSRTFYASWGYMDFNGHMRNTAYLDLAADTRLLYFQANGFPSSELERLRFGPVIQRDEVEYRRELHLLETFDVALEVDGLSPDGARFRLRNDFLRADGKLVARVTSTGGWLDLNQRKLAVPPPAIADLLGSLVRTDTFAVLPALST